MFTKSLPIYFFYAALVVTGCRNNGQSACSTLRQGDFYYKGENGFGYRVHRVGDTQVVINERNGVEQKEFVEWIDSCTYFLSPVQNVNVTSKVPSAFPLEVHVTEVAQKYYTVHICGNDNRTDFMDTAWIVRTY